MGERVHLPGSDSAKEGRRPFGSASEDFAKFETVLLVGGELRQRGQYGELS